MTAVTTNDGPILVAPRPVRVASMPHTPAPWLPVVVAPVARKLSSGTIDALERLTLDMDAGDTHMDQPHFSPARRARDLSPARSSPTVASEAWEEFLSILKPAVFQPSPSAGMFGAFRYATSPTFFTVPDRSFRHSPRLLSPISDARFDPVPVRPRASMLRSPVSRIHTRNPFQRQASCDAPTPMESVNDATVLHSVDISPRNVPLPSPGSDEVTFESI